MRSRWSIPLAAALGGLAALNFAPYRLPLAMWISVAGLFWLANRLQSARRRHVLAVGAIYGLAFMGTLIWWMNAVSSGAYVALVLVEAGFFAVIFWALRRVAPNPFALAGVWVVGELLRGSIPFSGFPWGRLAHTSLDTPLDAWVRLIGMAGTSLLMALVAALVVRRLAMSFVAAVVVLTIGAVLPTGLASPTGETRTIALIQGNTPGPVNSWPLGEIFDLHVAATDTIDRDVDLVIWPENGSDLDPFTNPAARLELIGLSARVNAPLLIGAILNGPSKTTAYNAGVVVDEHGPWPDYYVKQNIVPYGEYVPFRQLLGPVVPRFDRDIPRDLLPGHRPGAMNVANMIVGDTICWDIAYDKAIADSIGQGANVIVVQTSNASFMDFGRATQPEQQWDIARLRAIETGRWVLVPSTNGVSGMIDANGQVVKRAPTQQSATLIHDVPLASGTTRGIWSRIPVLALAVVLSVARFLRRRST